MHHHYAMQLLHLRSRSWRDSTPPLQSQANLVSSKRFHVDTVNVDMCWKYQSRPESENNLKPSAALCGLRPPGLWALLAKHLQPNPTHFNQFSKYYWLSCLTKKPQAHFVLLATRFQYLRLHVLFREWIFDVMLAFLTCILSPYLIQTS